MLKWDKKIKRVLNNLRTNREMCFFFYLSEHVYASIFKTSVNYLHIKCFTSTYQNIKLHKG